MKNFLKTLRDRFLLPIKNLLEYLNIYSNQSVDLKLNTSSYFVGTYTKIKVQVKNIDFRELSFSIKEGGNDGNYISPCKDNEFDNSKPDFMLCIGHIPGKYHILVTKISDGSVLNEFEFTVGTEWAGKNNGPSLSFHGISQGYATGSAWGGSTAGIETQNTNVYPAMGNRRIALILVDTASERYPSDPSRLQEIKDKWMNSLFNGIVDSDGITRSSSLYYREASYNNFDISGDIFGPIHLSGNYSDYFHNNGHYIAPSFPESVIVAAAVISIDLTSYDSIVFVVQQFTYTDIHGFQHTATDGTVPWPSSGIEPFAGTLGPKRVILMPHNWDRNGIHPTFNHELGHNLGLNDQYGDNSRFSQEVNARVLGDWDLMAWESKLPHFSLVHRLMLGWVSPGWIKLYNFASAGAIPVDETIILIPIEQGNPSAGNWAGIEIRIADGRNYYIEYRSGISSHIGDRNLPTNDAVLVSDVDSSVYVVPTTRRSILKVPNDADGDGSVLINGMDYRETDLSDPTFPADFSISISGINGSTAAVRIQYGVIGKPDPSIRPWPASPARQWQSPDIEVQNARNLADASWFNVPWDGHSNDLIARIKNNGNLDAPSVKVNFFIKNFNIGGAPETPIGSVSHDIPALTTVEFRTTWSVQQEGHYCVIARIASYQTPTSPAISEMTDLNNMAQSNYDRFISRINSPGSRETTYIEVGNPYPLATRVVIIPNQGNPLYRSYIEHKSLWLEAGDVKRIKIMFEYDPEYILHVPVSLSNIILNEKNRKELVPGIIIEYEGIPNNVKFACFIENPYDEHRHSVELLGGVDVQIVKGNAAKFEYYKRDNAAITGAVITEKDRKRVIGGKVIIIIHFEKSQEKEAKYITIELQETGEFIYHLTEDRKVQFTQGYYVPSNGNADCYSEKI